ncbi:MAG: hypothetical protein MJ230_04115 [bacterium]|nr:hypothetical protein [bacterium]
MINTIDTKVNQVEAPNQEQTQNRQYVTMRGNDYERTPDSDTYESSNKNNTGKTIGIAATLLAIGATIYAGCHGKNILEKAGKETGFMENIKTGYKNFFKKAENAVVNAEKNVEKKGEEAAAEAKKNAEEAAAKAQNKIEETTEKEVEKKVEETTEKEVEKKVEETAEKDYYKEYEQELEQELEQERQIIADSDKKNEEWLSKQRKNKEKEYDQVWQKGLKEKEARELATFRQTTGKNIPQIKSELQDAKTNLKNFEDKLAKLKNEYAKYNNPNMVDVESIAKRNALNEQIKALEEKIEHTKSFIDKSRKNLADLNSRCADDIEKLAREVVDGKWQGKETEYNNELNKIVDILGPSDKNKAMSSLRNEISDIAGDIERSEASAIQKSKAEIKNLNKEKVFDDIATD